MSDSISAEEYNDMMAKPKPSKYLNKKTVVDGIEFDSIAESNRYKELKLLEAAGEIEGLVLQPPYALVVNGVLVATYKADFLYFDNVKGCAVVEDVKGGDATKTPVYRLKKKLMKAIHGIEITEVEA